MIYEQMTSPDLHFLLMSCSKLTNKTPIRTKKTSNPEMVSVALSY